MSGWIIAGGIVWLAIGAFAAFAALIPDGAEWSWPRAVILTIGGPLSWVYFYVVSRNV